MTTQREFAPMLIRVWGNLSPAIAKLIVERPSLGHRLALAPRRVIHAVAVYTQWAIDDEHTTSDIASRLDQAEIRDLLPEAIPNLHPQFFGLLSRICGQVHDRRVYLRLNAALNGPASALLLRTNTIHPATLDLLEQVGADRVLLAGWQAVENDHGRGRALQNALAYLRALGVADHIEALPPGSGWSAIQRRIERDLGRLPTPRLPFDPPAGWYHVADIAAVTEVGRRFQNCLIRWTSFSAAHYMRAILGEIALLVSDAPIPLLAEVERIGPAVWRVGSVVGRSNRPADPDVQQALFEALSASINASRHTLLTGNPVFDLDAVLHRDGDAEPGWDRF